MVCGIRLKQTREAKRWARLTHLVRAQVIRGPGRLSSRVCTALCPLSPWYDSDPQSEGGARGFCPWKGPGSRQGQTRLVLTCMTWAQDHGAEPESPTGKHLKDSWTSGLSGSSHPSHLCLAHILNMSNRPHELLLNICLCFICLLRVALLFSP